MNKNPLFSFSPGEPKPALIPRVCWVKGFWTLCSSLDFALSLAPNHLDIFPLAVIPGTRLQETAPSFGLQHLAEIPYTVLASPGFCVADMRIAARTAQACDLLYNQGKAIPWFAILMDALGLAPSELFNRFADYLDTHADPDLTALQVGFFTSCLGDPKAASVAADIISYFGYSGALLEAVALEPQGATDRPMEASSRATRQVSFHHDPQALLELLESGITDLEQLVSALPDRPCQALLAVEGGEAVLEILAPGTR